MRKKMSIIATLTILAICLISSFVYAQSGDSMVRDATDGTANAINDGGQMIGNAVENGGDMIGNVISDGGAMVGNAVDSGTNMIDGNTPISNGIIDSQTIENVGGDAKNAVDTMTTANVSMSNISFLGINLSVWMWIVLIIIIIVVIVLICKYMKEHDNNDDEE